MRNVNKKILAKLADALGVHLDADDSDGEDSNDEDDGLPVARLDELKEWCANFDWRRPPSVESVPWDWTQHFDDNEAIYMAGNLQLIRTALYEQQYPELKAEQWIPHDLGGNPGIEREVVQMIDVAGAPEISRDQPDDVPSVELSTSEADVKFYEMSLAYSYSDGDVEKAMYQGRPLQYQKAKATRDIMARTKDTIAFLGSTKIGTKGLLNFTGTTTYAVPASGNQGSKKFKDKSAPAVLLDLNGAADQIIDDTNEIEQPDTWLLPSDAYNHINTRMVGDGTNETILSFFLRTRRGDGSTVNVYKTTKSKAGKIPGVAVSRMVVYRNDPSKLQFKVPIPFLQKQPQVHGFKTTTFCRMRLGELALWLPKSVCYADDIS